MRSLFAIVAVFAIVALSPSVFSQSQVFEHRSQGLINDGFMTADGTRLWLACDGGRIRYRDPSGAWSYQSVDVFVKDTIHRIHFLESGPGAGTGWAVAQDGAVLKTTNWGFNGWQRVETIVPVVQGPQYEDLFDIHFLDEMRGWIVGIHGIWYTTDGTTWLPALVLDINGGLLNLATVDLYAIDVVERSDGLLALVCGKPGYVLKNVPVAQLPPNSVPGSVFKVEWDAQSLPQWPQGSCENGIFLGAFAAWDLEILRNENEEKFALMVGGIGDNCGLAFSSTDDGTTWTNELHECKASPCAGFLYNDNPSTFTDTWRWQFFKGLYGLGLFSDRTAVAAGYNGQHVVREEVSGGVGMPPVGIWRDRSSYSNQPFHAPAGAVYFPFYGAVAARLGTAQGGKAQLMGVLGLLRGTTDGGATWHDDLPDEQWRTTAVHFVDGLTGWYTSQLFRIAKTTDGGLSWIEQMTGGALHTGAFKAITFDPSGQWGVAVGSPDPRSTVNFPDWPKIMHIDTQQSANTWDEPDTIKVESTTSIDQRTLRAVDWAGGQTFWTAGESGLIFVSQNAGAQWEQVADLSMEMSTFQLLEFEGLDFLDASRGLFVGWHRTRGVAQALWYDGGTWSDISPADPQIRRINDVKILGTTAYAVALHVDANGFRQGIVLKSDFSNGAFGQFAAPPPSQLFGVIACNVGSDLGRIQILNRIAVNPTNDDIWVGGECGRIWGFDGASGVWNQHKSQSDSHIVSMSLTPDGYLYLGMSRLSTTQQAIVRWKP